MDLKSIESSYARWAPIYDATFGNITNVGRRRAVHLINRIPGRVLEVGVGTGLSLPLYDPACRVTGIDFSEKMLAKARDKVIERDLTHVEDLRQMDARHLDFPDNSFDTIAAMHVLSVVPEPERVMAEIARVCKPGGRVVITNHFVRERGFMAFLERVTAPFANVLGWHSDFRIDTVLRDDLHVTQQGKLPPIGMMTFLVMEKPRAS
ncbi:phosphatidylethanolamine/phosphatidyl-N-methylethanolamine N-methyltransferase [Roseovarius pacificus]|uniref:Phosphatidylethanolamine/phosphatidyl-N-methylethanolamine N-methyltransferase n=1 Tax=Roseovarius pacificus TaxID=337701 RepID=A0A1M7E3B3_9RHOB|nr:class I SAM-dependent methyltransferase [Roseovarius pacificus]MDW3118131.1 class I SAM-dependent methyltransferase [Roseovarius pacificus]GGO57409.1 SAM-dependent methyltransferase [Roseovarius pacificus]SHL86197.1 phosphatidylethanolamine/phosphatidyl-N-methylethanolamine N-methyltransferase [Roseovarius pacificus]